ncbi:Coenzyme F420-dependent N5,N10-methylene tetrahydromethanopterin reductase and related flavin-dependent oxidoreductases; sulfonate monooxygenase [[Actinomadura] parvosata subsp. kistnae]|uniref:LLM class flavin-dependent oxidoreductase n=1 Tax=[Actinomadura] parvosata TaxID=1955412 RepID=UPI000D26B1C1|nr:Coenzyme F420-dependent N5,N10-methylene tetrahydromethanopterin reductase and related flavin-dependent oxidoreductases; sulfonate monooxygenase [Actinomadura parvosata subsp. kistnae]
MRVMSDNTFQLGLFAPNVWGGLTKTTAEQRWQATWDNNAALGKMADEAGLEFILPLAQWSQLKGASDTDGHTFEALSWAAGMLAATERITVFATVHSPFVHPLFAARQAVTCDHIGKGRFGLNIVSGSAGPDFAMFGTPMRDHDERYAYTEEWTTLVKRLWQEPEPFDFHGRFFDLKGVFALPGPYGGDRPTLISAGSSPAGRRFAARHADCLFMIIISPEGLAGQITAVRADAGRSMPVYASGHVICRKTRQETEEYYHYIVEEKGDWEAAEEVRRSIFGTGQKSLPPELADRMLERMVSGGGTFPVKGDPDDVAQTFKRLSDAGLTGMAVALVNYLDDFPILRDEVLPRMERLGLRRPAIGAGHAG